VTLISSGMSEDTLTGSCEYGNEPSGLAKNGEFVDH
jgi:hypothetical protein